MEVGRRRADQSHNHDLWGVVGVEPGGDVEGLPGQDHLDGVLAHLAGGELAGEGAGAGVGADGVGQAAAVGAWRESGKNELTVLTSWSQEVRKLNVPICESFCSLFFVRW